MNIMGDVNYLWFRGDYLVEALLAMRDDPSYNQLETDLKNISTFTQDEYLLLSFKTAGSLFYDVSTHLLKYVRDRKVIKATENSTDLSFLLGIQNILVQDEKLTDYFKVSNYVIGESFSLDEIASMFDQMSNLDLYDVNYDISGQLSVMLF